MGSAKRETYWKWLRWSARILAVGLVILLILFAYGEALWGYLQTNQVDSGEALLFAALGTTVIGLLLALFREGWGAVIVLVGTAAFVATNSIASGHLRVGVFDAAFAIVAVLFLAYAWHAQRNKQLF